MRRAVHGATVSAVLPAEVASVIAIGGAVLTVGAEAAVVAAIDGGRGRRATVDLVGGAVVAVAAVLPAEVAVAGVAGEVVSAVVVVGAAVSVGVVVASVIGPARSAGATVVVAGVWAVIDVAAILPSGTEVVIAAVVVVVAASPVSAVEAYAEVAEAVVDATVVADGGSPVAGVPEVAASPIAPITGGPEGAGVRREYPCAVNPLVAFTSPGPVAGSPDVAGARNCGLSVDGDSGRSDSDGDEDACLSRGGSDERCACKYNSAEDGGTECGAKTAVEVHCLPLPVFLRLTRTKRGFAERQLRFLPALPCGSGTRLIRHNVQVFVARG
jgi:hypothetical protein